MMVPKPHIIKFAIILVPLPDFMVRQVVEVAPSLGPNPLKL